MTDATRALDSGDIAVLTGRGDAYRRMGRLMEALTDLDRAIEIDPRYTGALVSRGKVYRARGENEAAHADFDLALTIDPERVRIWIDED